MDWKEKISFQLFQGNQACLSYLQHACQAQENDEWLNKKLKHWNMLFLKRLNL